jgi:hypothetical protein
MVKHYLLDQQIETTSAGDAGASWCPAVAAGHEGPCPALIRSSMQVCVGSTACWLARATTCHKWQASRNSRTETDLVANCRVLQHVAHGILNDEPFNGYLPYS